MRRDEREAHLDQDRRAGRGHDAVVRGRGNAHAENDAADHREDEANKGRGARELDDGVDEDGCKARDSDAACDHVCNCAGHADGNCALRARLQRFKDLFEREALVLVQKAYDDGGQN